LISEFGRFVLHEGLDESFELGGHLSGVVSRVLGPVKLGFVDISVGISNGGANDVICETESFDERNHLGADFLDAVIQGLNDQGKGLA